MIDKKLSFIGLSFKISHYEIFFFGEAYLIVGNDYENLVGINQRTGNVYSVSENQKTFINTTFEALNKCIDTFISIMSIDKDFDENIRTGQIRLLKEKLLSIDAQCLKEGNWWNYIVEQVEYGLL